MRVAEVELTLPEDEGVSVGTEVYEGPEIIITPEGVVLEKLEDGDPP